jgi:hypothetical protein
MHPKYNLAYMIEILSEDYQDEQNLWDCPLYELMRKSAFRRFDNYILQTDA